MYHAIPQRSARMKGAQWAPFDITDAGVFASGDLLKLGTPMLEVCDNCKCTYFTSVNQKNLR